MIKIPLKYTIRNMIKSIVLSKTKKIKHAHINGHEMLVPVDEGIGWLIYYLKRFDKKETDFISRTAGKNWVCFDIGANIGYYSLLFASLSREIQVHSFEPQPLCYHLLSSSILLNDFSNIRLNNCALGNHKGVSEFSISERCESSSFVHTEMSPLKEKIQVEVRRLDDYVEENGIEKIDLMKIDVEGSEKLVLEASVNTLSNAKLRPEVILIELYSPNFAHYNTSIDEITKLLCSYGYSAFIASKKRLIPFTKEHHNIFCNVFFVKDRNHQLGSRKADMS